ncbi:hypothetical protein ACNHKD_00865 [Methylocystis sp. JAN1]|uniref:hypothetical protein n=1 Tax=Methylocystis sp. JAN1 TaxID=3397211 RepID=UPI003FA22C71
MRKLVTILSAAAILASSLPALAQGGREFGDIQRYGGHWRYQHRDWSGLYGRPDPGVCWLWDDRTGQWLWTCSG